MVCGRAIIAVATPAIYYASDAAGPRAAFAAEHPCPDLGSYGLCIDVVDHSSRSVRSRLSLATMLDTPANMAWEAADEAEVKDRFERRLCRALGRAARQQLGPDAYRDVLVTYWRSVATLDNAALRARAAAELDGLAANNAAACPAALSCYCVGVPEDLSFKFRKTCD